MKAALSSFLVFQNSKNIIINFLIVPIFNTVFYYTLYNGSIDNQSILIFIVITTLLQLTILNSMSVVYEYNIGITRYIYNNTQATLKYLKIRYFVSLLLSCCLIIPNTIMFSVFYELIGVLNIYLLIFLIALIGLLIPLLYTLLCLGSKDPFKLVNLYSYFVYFIYGIVLLEHNYFVFNFILGTNLTNFLVTLDIKYLIYEFFLCIVYFLIVMLSVKYKRLNFFNQ